MVLCSYTCESKEYEYSPFILLHKNLVGENKKQGLENISKYFYLFYKTLINLPSIKFKRFKQKLYKFIQKEIKTEENNTNEKMISI